MEIIEENIKRYDLSSKNLDFISNEELNLILKKHNLLGEFPPSLGIFQVKNNSVFCTNKEDISEVIKYRAFSYESYISKVIKEYKIEFEEESCFLIDLSDGCPDRNVLNDLKNVCLAGSVPNAKKTQAIPIVDAYYAQNPNNYFEKIEFSKTKWINKKDSLVWRGGCMPTLLTKIPEASAEWTHQRLKFCQKHFNNFDVGFHEVNQASWAEPYRQFKKDYLSPKEMSEYKFIAQIQGISACYNAPFWILASGSVMIWIIDEEQETLNKSLPTWNMWFHEMLKPYEHYVPSTIDKLQETIAWCLDNQGKCIQIIENAKQIQKHIMSIADDGTAQVLRKISDCQFKSNTHHK
jgi:hypothetical protein